MTTSSTVLKSIKAIATDKIILDPQQFQYKVGYAAGGATGSLSEVKIWNQYLAGVVQVWRLPGSRKIFCVNGHNRLALAKRLGITQILVQFIDTETAESAKRIGALINIAQGRGTVIDAAKLFQGQIKQFDLEEFGVPMRERMAADGLALSKLSPNLLDQVIQGTLALERGILIGDRLSDHTLQHKLLELVKDEGKRRSISNDVIRELADIIDQSPTVLTTQQTLFGLEETSSVLALEKARLLAELRVKLQREKRLFGLVSKQQTATELQQGGNWINTQKSQQISEEAAIVLGCFDTLKLVSGPVSTAVNRALLELSQMTSDEARKSIKAELYQEVKTALMNLTPGISDRKIVIPA